MSVITRTREERGPGVKALGVSRRTRREASAATGADAAAHLRCQRAGLWTRAQNVHGSSRPMNGARDVVPAKVTAVSGLRGSCTEFEDELLQYKKPGMRLRDYIALPNASTQQVLRLKPPTHSRQPCSPVRCSPLLSSSLLPSVAVSLKFLPPSCQEADEHVDGFHSERHARRSRCARELRSDVHRRHRRLLQPHLRVGERVDVGAPSVTPSVFTSTNGFRRNGQVPARPGERGRDRRAVHEPLRRRGAHPLPPYMYMIDVRC